MAQERWYKVPFLNESSNQQHFAMLKHNLSHRFLECLEIRERLWMLDIRRYGGQLTIGLERSLNKELFSLLYQICILLTVGNLGSFDQPTIFEKIKIPWTAKKTVP